MGLSRLLQWTLYTSIAYVVISTVILALLDPPSWVWIAVVPGFVIMAWALEESPILTWIKEVLRTIRDWLTPIRWIAIGLIVFAGSISVVGYCCTNLNPPPWSFCKPITPLLTDFYANFSTELISIVMAIVVIDELNEKRLKEQEKRQEKRRLILQMGSPDNSFAREAVRILRAEGWLEDGSLKGANLEKANLAGADLCSANLEGACLFEVNLEGASLRDANLIEAKLAGQFKSNLVGADLYNASLAGANLRHANLKGASLWNANLEWAELVSANLKKARLSQANLSEADLSYANLKGASLWNANLKGAKLVSANLKKANLEYANLSEADLSYANLKGALLPAPAKLEEANLEGATLPDRTQLPGRTSRERFEGEPEPDWRTPFGEWDKAGRPRVQLNEEEDEDHADN